MPTEWQNHLNAYRNKNPSLSLKECMQNASKTYRGNSSSDDRNSQSQSKSHEISNRKVIMNDVIGLSKAISHVHQDLNRHEIKKIQHIADELQKIHDSHFSDESDYNTDQSESE